ncbi:uncharacterized protein LOC128670114 [Plodia interpunctella]|uniref:uncharacterized protein LOC128670114 n=1 Tax=Plodia interpunctella TaxID=58824 RepID=UPI00236811CB|nr:uncharacterized protein LOC128670114 [Plodia interpunctella]
MLRLSLLCVVAGVAVSAVAAEDTIGVVARIPYSEKLRLVQQAITRMGEQLVWYKPRVDTREFHYLLVVGVVDHAAKRLVKSRRSAPEELINALNIELPSVYRDPKGVSYDVREDVNNVTDALKPLVELKAQYCENLDDKDCDKVVELNVLNSPTDLNVAKAVIVLESAAKVASSYLEIQEKLVTAANDLSSLGYLIKNRDTLAKLVDKHALVLNDLNLLL